MSVLVLLEEATRRFVINQCENKQTDIKKSINKLHFLRVYVRYDKTALFNLFYYNVGIFKSTFQVVTLFNSRIYVRVFTHAECIESKHWGMMIFCGVLCLRPVGFSYLGIFVPTAAGLFILRVFAPGVRALLWWD